MPYAEPLTEAELESALIDEVPGWAVDGAALRRTVRCGGFRAAIALVNGVADLAEAANHHPDISLHDYRLVTFTLVTHAAGAITRRDVELAAGIDRLLEDGDA